MIVLDDLEALFQPRWFYDSMLKISNWSWTSCLTPWYSAVVRGPLPFWFSHCCNWGWLVPENYCRHYEKGTMHLINSIQSCCLITCCLRKFYKFLFLIVRNQWSWTKQILLQVRKGIIKSLPKKQQFSMIFFFVIHCKLDLSCLHTASFFPLA